MYIYIYIYKERERETVQKEDKKFNISTFYIQNYWKKFI